MPNGQQIRRNDPKITSLIKVARGRLLPFASAEWITRFPDLVEGFEDNLRRMRDASTLPRDNRPLTEDPNDDDGTRGSSMVHTLPPTHSVRTQSPSHPDSRLPLRSAVHPPTQSPAARSLRFPSPSQSSAPSPNSPDVEMAEVADVQQPVDAHAVIGATVVCLCILSAKCAHLFTPLH